MAEQAQHSDPADLEGQARRAERIGRQGMQGRQVRQGMQGRLGGLSRLSTQRMARLRPLFIDRWTFKKLPKRPTHGLAKQTICQNIENFEHKPCKKIRHAIPETDGSF